MKHKPKLSDVMTADPATAHIGQPLSEVHAMLQASSFHHVPVLEGARPVGMIAATDILRLVYDVDGQDDRMLTTMLDHQFTLEDAMTTDLLTATRSDPLRQVVDQLSAGNAHSVLVVDEAGELEGIVTSTDLIRQLGELL